MAKMQKKRDPELWLLNNRNGKAPSAATVAMFKGEEDSGLVNSSTSLVHTSGKSLGPGGRRLKMVDKGGASLFGDDEDGDVKRKRKQDGADGDYDEMVYEEDFADDDEKIEDNAEDEEAKELEVYCSPANFMTMAYFKDRNDSNGSIRLRISNERAMSTNPTRKTTLAS
jgi:transcription initiation factor TFIIF subunit alpha